MKLLFVALGCAKNTVDGERMLYLLTQAGYTPTTHAHEAEVAVVNTCAFLESARQEAIAEILELAQQKQSGKLHTLVVAGCMPQLVKDEILVEMPEVDGIVGCGRVEEAVEIINNAVAKQRPVAVDGLDSPVVVGERLLSSSPASAYLKISEGCDNHCAYCLIPKIRGPFRSAPMEDLVTSAEKLVQNGVRELIIVSQDTTRYGEDLYGKPKLAELLEKLCEIEGLHWIRLHYLYPSLLDDRLIDVITKQPKVVKYLDIPIQHVDDGVLNVMNRPDSYEQLDALFAKLRGKIDNVVLRTTVMVGFPSEDDAAFERLYRFLRKHKIERAGVFVYSPEEGTPAAAMSGQVDETVAAERQAQLQQLQLDLMDEFNTQKIGTTIEVLCEGYDAYAECWFGRSYADSPEVDGKVFFIADGDVNAGDFVSVAIEDVVDGDLYGEAV
ncbi:MAG: 30S ribosomal protein S12 methylthiotransferase RimO [Oscillospiraceae bacterium]|nr:30S ribosomal protein S12 methylthiotransferase RimO [Oscillospiraceae bacterium]